MDLVNPFEEQVIFGKAYPVAWPPSGATTLAALVPTGRHVSHANDLTRVRNAGGGGGPATRLERYGRRKVSKGSPQQGLEMAMSRTAGMVMPRRSVSGGKPDGPLTAALKRRRNTPANPNAATASKSGLRIR